MKTKTKKETIAQEALRLISPIKPSEFITGFYSDRIGKCCVLGHYSRLKSTKVKSYDPWGFNFAAESNLRVASRKFLREIHGIDKDASSVNNTSSVNGYTQRTIKGRVVNLLKDMVKSGY